MAAELISQLWNANCIIALGTKWNDKTSREKTQTQRDDEEVEEEREDEEWKQIEMHSKLAKCFK